MKIASWLVAMPKPKRTAATVEFFLSKAAKESIRKAAPIMMFVAVTLVNQIDAVILQKLKVRKGRLPG